MRHLSIVSLVLFGTMIGHLHSVERAEAIPLLDFGPKIGYGSGVFTGSPLGDPSMNSLAFGVAASLDLVMVQLEADLLYLKNTTEVATGSTDAEYVSVPIIARVDISPIPMVKFAVGGGFERRMYLGDGESSELNYVPISARADLKVPMIGSAGVEGRFNYQMGDEDDKVHEFMLFLHVFL